MLWLPTQEARTAYLLAALTWDLVLIGIMAHVVISVLGWLHGVPVVIGVVIWLFLEAYEKLHRPRRRRSD